MLRSIEASSPTQPLVSAKHSSCLETKFFKVTLLALLSIGLLAAGGVLWSMYSQSVIAYSLMGAGGLFSVADIAFLCRCKKKKTEQSVGSNPSLV